jgi:hypothetical protein
MATIPNQCFISMGNKGTVWRGSDVSLAESMYAGLCRANEGSGVTVTLTVRNGDLLTVRTNCNFNSNSHAEINR